MPNPTTPLPTPDPAADGEHGPDAAAVTRLLRPAAAIAATAAALTVLPTLGWPIVYDASLMYYLGWRVADGAVPYTDVWDMNMPGTYVLHVGMYALFGTSALAWRLLDLAATGVGAAAIVGLVGSRGRHAAVLAAAAFAQYHVMYGPRAVGERDYFLSVLMLGAAWLVLPRPSRARPGPGALVLAGALLGFGCTLKPLAAVFGLATAAVVADEGRRRGDAIGAVLRDLGALGFGALGVGATVFAWIASLGGLPGLQRAAGDILQVHVNLRAPLVDQVRWLLLKPPVLLVPLALYGLAFGPEGARAHRLLLGAGVIYGLVHWFFQGKGFDYHVDPLVALVAPAAALGWERAWRGRPWDFLGPALTVTFGGVLALSTAWAWWHVGTAHHEELVAPATALDRALGEGETVQIFGDVASGIETLVERRVPMATPLLYDFHLYERGDAPEVRAWRAKVMAAMEAAQPDVVMFSEMSWPTHTFDRLAKFPELRRLLRDRYKVEAQGVGFRIYRRAPATP